MLSFAKPKRAIGLDIGTHSVKAVCMARSGSHLFVDEVGYAVIDRNQATADPVTAHASAVRLALEGMPLASSLVVAALAGQTAVIRYPRLPQSARDRLDEAVMREASQSIPYDLAEVFSDYAVLGEVGEGEQKQLRILLAAAKNEVIESRMQVLQAAEVTCHILTVDSLALADAAEACDFLRVGETVAIINVGLTSSSIHFVRDGVSNFIRDIAWGGRELIQAIAKERRVDYDTAIQTLEQYEEEAPTEEKPAHEPPATAPASQSPFGDLGGGSPLEPLEEELGLNVPSAPVAAATSPTKDLEKALRVPMSRFVSEIRRSFDYYEHQLYERPADRILLCGGVAPFAPLRSLIAEELGIESVEVANPLASSLQFGRSPSMSVLQTNPSQFMVALGLGARGTAEL